MANPDQVPDPPPSIDAAELRRRLLASTPPPMAPGATGPIDVEGLVEHPGSPSSSNRADLLARLKMPGAGEPHSLPPTPAAADSLGTGSHPEIPVLPTPQAAINRRPPIVGIRSSGMDLSAVPTAGVHPYYGVPSAMPAHTPVAYPIPPARAPGMEDPTQSEVARLRNENKELRQLLDEMKHLLQEASDTEQQFANRQQELQEELAEKQRQLDELSAQMQAIEEQIASGELGPTQPQAAPKTRTELEEWSDELEKESVRLAQERRKLDEERQQLREDEEALEHQMREMEVSMARERALMARQETELKRLAAEIQHELEMMQRGDVSLREQMAKFQRRANDVMQGRIGGPPGGNK